MESTKDLENVDSEIQIFQNALEFSEVKAREAMVPRTEIVAAESTESMSDIKKIFTSSGLSKIPFIISLLTTLKAMFMHLKCLKSQII